MNGTAHSPAVQALIDAAVQAALADAERAREAAREGTLKRYIAVKAAREKAAADKAEAEQEAARIAEARVQIEKTRMEWEAAKAKDHAVPFPASLAAESAKFKAALTGEQQTSLEDDDSEDAGSGSDQNSPKKRKDTPNDDANDTPSTKKRKQRTAKGPKLGAPPLYKAMVIETADNDMRVTASTADIDENILDRMKKCLATANHPSTPEGEARRALHVASRLMKQYNVTQAEVLAHATPEQQLQLGGHSVVAILRNDGDLTKSVYQNIYIGSLAYAISIFFGTKHFTTKYFVARGSNIKGLKVTFHGIAPNTVAAATAFEMVHNLMVEWARKHSGVVGRSSYCVGICDELECAAKQEKKEEMDRAKKAEARAMAFRLAEEAAQRERELSRLAGPPMDDVPAAPPGPTMDNMAEDETDEDYLARSRLDSASVFLDAVSYNFADVDSDTRSECSGSKNGGGYATDDDEDDEVIVIDDEAYVEADIDDDGDGELPDGLGDHTHAFWNDVLGTRAKNTTSAAPDEDDEEVNTRSEPVEDEIFADASPAATSVSVQPSPRADLARTPEPEFAGPSQLMLFREQESTIADDVLKKLGIKLRTGRKRHWKAFDQEARSDGRVDGKNIPVKIKTLKNGSAVVVDGEEGRSGV